MRILLADDHELMRDGLVSALKENFSDTDIIEAKNGEETVSQLNNNPPFDLLLLDLYMPDTDGFELLRTICDKYLDLPVVIISGSEDINDMRKVIDYGASGFLPKGSGRQVMMSALQLVLSGGVYIPPQMLSASGKEISSQHSTSSARNEKPDTMTLSIESENTDIKLTQRQRDVLRLLIDGASNKVIARQLGLAENTVKIHVASIFKSLGVANRTQAALEAQKLGLVD